MRKNGLHQHRSKKPLQPEVQSSGKWKRPPTASNSVAVWVICNYDAYPIPTIKESTIQAWVWSFLIVMVRSWSVEWENFREEKLQHKQNWQLLYGLCKHVRCKDILKCYLKWTMKQPTTYSQFIYDMVLAGPPAQEIYGFSAKNNFGSLKLILT